MSIKTKLGKLEQRAQQHYETLHLPDGTVVNHTSDDAMAAFSAAIAGRPHWLIPIFRQMDTTKGVPCFVKEWMESSEKHGIGARDES